MYQRDLTDLIKTETIKKLLFFLLCIPCFGFCQDVIYGEEIKKMEKIYFGDEITAHYFQIKEFDENLNKYIIINEGFCESNLLPSSEDYYYFKFNDCLKELNYKYAEKMFGINFFRVFWNYSEDKSTKFKDIYDTEGSTLEFNYRSQTISYYFSNLCFIISKLEVK